MKIKIDKNKEYKCKRPYLITEKLKAKVYKEIQRLIKEGIIRRARNTYYASPVFPIEKKNGSIKLVVYYREINKITQKDGCLFSSIQDELRSIPKSRIFS